MDLPTYTNIWRIEKRLYKLYDLRLPMPLPLVQIGVFAGVFVPWIVLLKVVGIPFASPWHVLYIVPPGVLTWMSTRPVIEGKRLTELLLSHSRYLSEPRTWCRLTPIREPREVTVVARVWRRPQAPAPVAAAERAAIKSGRKARKARKARPVPREAAVPALAPAPATLPSGPAAQPAFAPPPAAVPFAPQAPALVPVPGPTAAPAPQPLAEYAAQREGPSAEYAGPSYPSVPPHSVPSQGTRPEAVPQPQTTRPVPQAPAAQRQPAVPQSVQRQPPGPQSAQRQPAVPQAAGPQGSGPRATGPQAARPNAARPPAAGSRQAAGSVPGSLGTEDDVRVAGPEVLASPSRPAPKPWRRTERDISHEDDVRVETARNAPAEVERPPATPQLEAPPSLGVPEPEPAPGSGKRALASGVRRPGAAPEFWQAAEPSDQPGRPEAPAATRRDIPRQPEPGKGAPQEPPRAPVTQVGYPQRPENEPEAPRERERALPPATPPATRTDVPQRPVRGPQRPAADLPGPPPPTRPDIPMVPGAFGAPSPAPAAASASGDGAAGAEEAEWRPAGPAAAGPPPAGQAPAGRRPPAGKPAETPAEPIVRKDPPKPWSEGLSKPPRPASTDATGTTDSADTTNAADATVWPPVTEPRADAPRATPQQPGRTSPAAQGRFPAPASPPQGTPPRGTPLQGPPPRGVPLQGPPPQGTPPRGTPTQGTPSQGTPPRGVPLQSVPPQGASPQEGPLELPPQGIPIEPPPQFVPEEQAPPREVRSGPASPVRPRPLPPPPAPPPSGPAITPPDPEHEVTGGGLRRLIQAVGGGHGEADAEYQLRLQQPFQGTRHIVVLGCTGGAGQTVTGLMLGHTFAQHNGEPVVAIDVNPGPGALARRTRSETNETLTSLITRADQVTSLTAMRRYTSQAKSGLDVIAAGKNPLQALDDRDYALAVRTLDRFYSVTLLDAAAAVVARVLPYADQVVLVAPASSDAPRAVAMTFEWLDGHGYEELRSRAVTVINGVSRRSMDDVEQAEAVARGRCRALVRIPWDDHLSMDRAPRNELRSLRAPTRRAYLALAGVVAGGFTVVPERYQELQQEQEATR